MHHNLLNLLMYGTRFTYCRKRYYGIIGRLRYTFSCRSCALRYDSHKCNFLRDYFGKPILTYMRERLNPSWLDWFFAQNCHLVWLFAGWRIRTIWLQLSSAVVEYSYRNKSPYSRRPYLAGQPSPNMTYSTWSFKCAFLRADDAAEWESSSCTVLRYSICKKPKFVSNTSSTTVAPQLPLGISK